MVATSLIPIAALLLFPAGYAFLLLDVLNWAFEKDPGRFVTWSFLGGYGVSFLATIGATYAIQSQYVQREWVVRYREEGTSMKTKSVLFDNLSSHQQDVILSARETGTHVTRTDPDFAGRMQVFIDSEPYVFRVYDYVALGDLSVPFWVVPVAVCAGALLLYNLVLGGVFVKRAG